MRDINRLRFSGVLVCAHILSCTVAFAADDAATRANRGAYELAKKCAVVGVIGAGDSRKANDRLRTEAYQAASRRSFDAAYTLGEKIGLEATQISKDLDFAQLSEVPMMLRDREYLAKTNANCKAVGLIQ